MGLPGRQLHTEVWSGEASAAGCVPRVCGADPASGQAFSGSCFSLDGVPFLDVFQSQREEMQKSETKDCLPVVSAEGACHVVQPRSAGAAL